MPQETPRTRKPPPSLITEMPEAEDISYSRLTHTAGGHNKYWEVWVCRAGRPGTRYLAYARWGKIGSFSRGKLFAVGTENVVKGIANRKTREKLSKGYVIQETGQNVKDLSHFLSGPTGPEAQSHLARFALL